MTHPRFFNHSCAVLDGPIVWDASRSPIVFRDFRREVPNSGSARDLTLTKGKVLVSETLAIRPPKTGAVYEVVPVESRVAGWLATAGRVAGGGRMATAKVIFGAFFDVVRLFGEAAFSRWKLVLILPLLAGGIWGGLGTVGTTHLAHAVFDFFAIHTDLGRLIIRLSLAIALNAFLMALTDRLPPWAAPEPVPAPVGPMKRVDDGSERYVRESIRNFIEKLPNGDADFAKDRQLALALMGLAGANEPYFEV